jgi:hypothetical protein
VLAAIREARPVQLFVALDGPRKGRAGDYEFCQATRNLLREQIDWECEVQTLLREHNLGCRPAVSSAITWFFDHVEQGIVLEDDCLPVSGFFGFCEALLKEHAANPTVMHISGSNFQEGRVRGSGSYYASRYAHIWGWATWRRAWQHYDVTMRAFPEFKAEGRIKDVSSSEQEQGYWLRTFEKTHSGALDTWDYQWQFAIWAAKGLTLLPNTNLVKNIGFGAGATHTGRRDWTPPARNFAGPIVHPPTVKPDDEADAFTFAHVFSRRSKRPWWQALAARSYFRRASAKRP